MNTNAVKKKKKNHDNVIERWRNETKSKNNNNNNKPLITSWCGNKSATAWERTVWMICYHAAREGLRFSPPDFSLFPFFLPPLEPLTGRRREKKKKKEFMATVVAGSILTRSGNKLTHAYALASPVWYGGHRWNAPWRQRDDQLNLINMNRPSDFAADNRPRKFRCAAVRLRNKFQFLSPRVESQFSPILSCVIGKRCTFRGNDVFLERKRIEIYI